MSEIMNNEQVANEVAKEVMTGDALTLKQKIIVGACFGASAIAGAVVWEFAGKPLAKKAGGAIKGIFSKKGENKDEEMAKKGYITVTSKDVESEEKTEEK